MRITLVDVTQFLKIFPYSSFFMATATIASAFFAYRLMVLTKYEWESKRPYLTSTSGQVLLSDKFIMGSAYYNISSSSAREVRYYQKAYICDKSENDTFPAQYLKDTFYNVPDNKIPPKTISSGMSLQDPNRVLFGEEEANLIGQGKKDLYFVSQITYEDDFKHSYKTQTCDKVGPLISTKFAVTDSRPCELFNCSDDDCNKQFLQKSQEQQEQKCQPFEGLPIKLGKTKFLL